MAKIIGKNIGDIPGTFKDYGGGVVPSYYLLCDGSSKLVASFSALFAAIGYTYGGAGANFSVPDSRRKVHVGSGGTGSGTLGNAVGNTGGEETHQLTVPETPSHTHIQNAHNHTITDTGHTHNAGAATTAVSGGGVGVLASTPNTNATSSNPTGISLATATPTNQNTGGDGTHNNIQPSLVVTKMIKY